jgi:hypothetical protein
MHNVTQSRTDSRVGGPKPPRHGGVINSRVRYSSNSYPLTGYLSPVVYKTVLAGRTKLVSEAAPVKYSIHHYSFRAYKQKSFLEIAKHGFRRN